MYRRVFKKAVTAFLCVVGYLVQINAREVSLHASSEMECHLGGAAPHDDTVSTVTETFALYYRFDRIDVDSLYLDNQGQIAHIRHYLAASPRIDSITIYSWASPEGAYGRNLWLSRERGKAAKRFLLRHSPDSLRLNSDKIRLSPLAENWPGLLRLVEQNYTRHDREKVLKILRATDIGDETRKWRLQQLDNGYTWKYLIRKYMPELRAATWVCVWAEVIPPLERPDEPKDTLENPLKLARRFSPPPAPEPVTIAAVRTNLLVPGLNVGVELPIGDRWSAAADYYYPWFWPGSRNKDCFELLGWSAELRYWFGKEREAADRLKGHSVAAYAAAGYYDFERNYKGLQGEFVSAGLDYTYALALGRKGRVNMEFTIALGYIHSWNRTYTVPVEYGGLFRDPGTMMFDYFGPTKAAVSIVVPIFGKEGGR